jgi:predicted DNA-binding transcriptional regulator AlpA
MNANQNPKLGPHKPVPVPPDAVWMSTNQVLARYGGRSQMWLWRKIQKEPAFPRPTYFGRMLFFRVDELEAYERAAVATTPPARHPNQTPPIRRRPSSR